MNRDDLSQQLENNPDFVDLKKNKSLKFDLKYTTIDNFLNANLYGDFKGCFLHRMAATKLNAALHLLQQTDPQATFLIYDGLRPRKAQWLMWNKVVGTAQQKYIGDPNKGSMHNFGLAVDLTLFDLKTQNAWDMGTDFDHFSPLAEPELDEQHLQAGKLSLEQINNRKKLYQVMTQAGFTGIRHEWWHYNATHFEDARQNYTLIE